MKKIKQTIFTRKQGTINKNQLKQQIAHPVLPNHQNKTADTDFKELCLQ